jgi:hypothetical protein
MWVNDAKFLDNGRSGYVLKPKYMRENNIKFHPESKYPVQKTLFVEVISGFQLPKQHGKEDRKKGEIIDPYVRVYTSGLSADRKNCRTKTISILKNSYN